MKHENIKALQRRVDEILYYLWDPIGVKDEPAARSEYSNYATSISSLLLSKKDQESIAKQLMIFERDNMGLVPADENHAMEMVLSPAFNTQINPAINSKSILASRA